MFTGAAWAIGMRWCMRLIGLVSVVILARLLTPADFGLVAMATLVIALIDSFSEFGTEMMLMRQAEATRAQCDTAWSFRIIQGAITAVVILAAAPFASRYFNDSRLVGVMAVLAVVAVVGSAGNIGMTLIRRELKFATDFRFGLYVKLANFFPTLALAYVLRDYWALVLGNLVGAVVGVIISYRMHPYRPRFSLAMHREYLAFSVDVVASNIARLLKNKVDVLVLGGVAGPSVTGQYNVASELARMGTQEIVIPAWRGLFPSFASLKSDHSRFIAAYLNLVAGIATFCLPLGIGLSVLAVNLIPALLGSQWTAAVVPMQWLSLAAALLALSDTFGGNILFVSGHQRRAAVLLWVHLLLQGGAVFAASRIGGMNEFAQATALVSALMVPISAVVVTRSLGLSAWALVGAVWRPFAAAVVMGLVIHAASLTAVESNLAQLVLRGMLGIATYVGAAGLLWVACKRPTGVEQMIVEWLAARLTGRARA